MTDVTAHRTLSNGELRDRLVYRGCTLPAAVHTVRRRDHPAVDNLIGRLLTCPPRVRSQIVARLNQQPPTEPPAA